MKHSRLIVRSVQWGQDGRRITYQQTSSIFRVQCKLNLQADQINLHEVLIDKLTNRSVRCLRNSENELTDKSVQILEGSKEMNLQTYQFESI
jgi:hypothetical protein